MRSAMTTTILTGALALAACKGEPSPGTTSTTSTTSPQAAPGAGAAAAKELFKTRCVPCHGESGKGDGPGSVALNPKPRNYTDPTWQNTVKDDEIKKAILYGGAAVGKSPAMPANPDLEGKPELDGLVAVVRSFKGK